MKALTTKLVPSLLCVMAVFTMENSSSMQNWEFEHSLEMRVNIEIEKKWQSKDLGVRVSHRLWTRKVIFCLVLIFLQWSGEGLRHSYECCSFHLDYFSCWPGSENSPGRDRWYRGMAWMGTMRFLVLSPLNLFSPDMEGPAFSSWMAIQVLYCSISQSPWPC